MPQSEVVGRRSRPLSGQRETAKHDRKGGGQSGAAFRVARNGCKGFPHPPASARAKGTPLPPARWPIRSLASPWVKTGRVGFDVGREAESHRVFVRGSLVVRIYIMRTWSLDGLCCRCPRATPFHSFIIFFFLVFFIYITG